jgi:hypothetical protein
MILLKELVTESLDTPYKYRNSFRQETIDYEDEETGEKYPKEVLSPVQIVKFKTDEGIPYLWYAKQSRYDSTYWTIAFGVETGVDDTERYQLDIGTTKTGNAFRVFATVISIINSFIEFDDDNYEVQHLMFSSKGENRTRLYIKYLVPRIENFEIRDVRNSSDETEVILDRKF